MWGSIPHLWIYRQAIDAGVANPVTKIPASEKGLEKPDRQNLKTRCTKARDKWPGGKGKSRLFIVCGL